MRTQIKLVPITGNTYPVKDQLRALGCRWNAEEKCWMAPVDKEEEAKAIVSGDASTPRKASDFRHSRCRDCGAAPTRYNRIYRNGQCRDCFVSDKEEAEMGY